MKTANCTGAIALMFMVAANVSAQAGGTNVNAAIMFSQGENSTCTFGNINDAYVIIVSAVGNKPVSKT